VSSKQDSFIGLTVETVNNSVNGMDANAELFALLHKENSSRDLLVVIPG